MHIDLEICSENKGKKSLKYLPKNKGAVVYL